MSKPIYMKFTTREEAFQAALERRASEEDALLLETHREGDNLWSLIRNRDSGELGIRLDVARVNPSRKKWEYRAWRDDEFPRYFDCPIAFLRATTNTNPMAIEWRITAIRAQQWDQRARAFEIEPGTMLTVGGRQYQVIMRDERKEVGAWLVRWVGSDLVVSLSRTALASGIYRAILAEMLPGIGLHDRFCLFGTLYELNERKSDGGWVANDIASGVLVYLDLSLLRYAIAAPSDERSHLFENNGSSAEAIHPRPRPC